MDLLNEEERLIKKKDKAMENFERKAAYLDGAEIALAKARHDVRVAKRKLKAIRQQIDMEGIVRPHLPPVEAIVESEPIEENTD